MRRTSSLLLLAAAWPLCCPGTAGAAVKLTARLFDGEESTRVVLDAMQKNESYRASLKVPIAGSELTVELVEVPPADGVGASAAPRSWKATTDEGGAFEVDTGLESLPATGFFVVRTVRGGVAFYSPFVRPGTSGPIDVHVYPTTENPADVQANLRVLFDVQGPEDSRVIRVRCILQLTNRGGAMYVGRKAGGSHREIWRLPIPPDATILVNKGPTPDLPTWRLTADKKAVVLDAPLGGIFEISRDNWEIHYTTAGRQRFVQSYPLAFGLGPSDLSFWCTSGAMTVTSPRLKGQQPAPNPDPITGEMSQLAVTFSTEQLSGGAHVPVEVTADNVALDQWVAVGPAKWVGGFVLVCVLSILLGLALGPRGPSAEAVLESLSGEEVLDRIAQLDLRRQQGKIGEAEYVKAREALVALAAEELTAPGAGATPGPNARLTPEAQQLLRRIDELDRAGTGSPARDAERLELLNALLRALPRGEAGKG